MREKIEKWRDSIRHLCRYNGHRCEFRELAESIEQSMTALLARTLPRVADVRDGERLDFLIAIADRGGRITRTHCGEYRIDGDWTTERRDARESIDAAIAAQRKEGE